MEKKKNDLSKKLWLGLKQKKKNVEDSAYNLLVWLCVPQAERTSEIVGYINGTKREVIKKAKVFKEEAVQFLKSRMDCRFRKKVVQDLVEMIIKVEGWRADVETLSCSSVPTQNGR